MKQITLNGTSRTVGSKSDIKALRKEGKVPCVVYGNGVANLNFSAEVKEFKTITDTPASHIVNLVIDGKEYLAVLHDVQYHPLTDEPLHADFLAVNEKKPIAIDVPVRVFGNSEGVKQGGKLTVNVRKLRVSGLLKDLPDELPVDITTLKLGKQINAGDLNFDKISIISPKTTIVCAVKATRNVTEAEAPAAEQSQPQQ
ncbi:MAG: 50S ribosomal protein L25 [Bacteroidales bacterium]|nr:50S ribosomal protein L25 [Bacteroidales bacterium]